MDDFVDLQSMREYQDSLSVLLLVLDLVVFGLLWAYSNIKQSVYTYPLLRAKRPKTLLIKYMCTPFA